MARRRADDGSTDAEYNEYMIPTPCSKWRHSYPLSQIGRKLCPLPSCRRPWIRDKVKVSVMDRVGVWVSDGILVHFTFFTLATRRSPHFTHSHHLRSDQTPHWMHLANRTHLLLKYKIRL